MRPREIVRASAGAGKTFRISSRIIGLLASGEAPSDILASTFTRKAAGEILDRVLVRVAEAVLDPEKARTHSAAVSASSGSSCSTSRWWRSVKTRFTASSTTGLDRQLTARSSGARAYRSAAASTTDGAAPRQP
ncbi:MAG: UvrD-helicase domain-containing protein [Gemmatimonadota bacterium]